MNIKNKVAIVTGGAGGMGFEISRALLINDAKFVALFDLPDSGGENLLKKLGTEFGKDRVDFYPCDITLIDKVEENFKQITKKHGCVDILINNAGVGNERNIQRMVDVNVTAVLNFSLLVITHMGKHKGGKGGVIVNVNGILGLSDCPMLPFYSATKHAIIGFTRCMKENYHTTGVKVMSVCPGVTKTNLIKEIPHHIFDFVSDELKEKTLNEVPVQSPQSVGSTVVGIIQKGEPGAIWVVEDDKKPYAIKPIDHYVKMSKPIS